MATKITDNTEKMRKISKIASNIPGWGGHDGPVPDALVEMKRLRESDLRWLSKNGHRIDTGAGIYTFPERPLRNDRDLKKLAYSGALRGMSGDRVAILAELILNHNT